MKRKYRVLVTLDVWMAAELPIDAERLVFEELEGAERNILELEANAIPIPLCPATLQAVQGALSDDLPNVEETLYTLYNTLAIHTVAVSMSVNIIAESEDEALKGVGEELEKVGRQIYDLNIAAQEVI